MGHAPRAAPTVAGGTYLRNSTCSEANSLKQAVMAADALGPSLAKRRVPNSP